MKHTFPLCLDVDQHALYWGHISGNKTSWILGAMAERYQRETGKNAHHLLALAKAARLGKGRQGTDSAETAGAAQELLSHVPPVVESPAAAPPKVPVRHALWLPTSEELDAGFYIVKPDSFATMDGGSWHFIQVEPGPAYPFSDGWTGQRVKWKPAETAGPFTPDAGVLEAALAADAARVAAILARR